MKIAFRADQFKLESNFRAHYLHTGPEILRQAAGEIDCFCDFAGTEAPEGRVAGRIRSADMSGPFGNGEKTCTDPAVGRLLASERGRVERMAAECGLATVDLRTRCDASGEEWIALVMRPSWTLCSR